MDMELGERLRARRKKKRLTMAELAGRVGCDESYISRLEAGDRSLSGFRLGLRLCRELGLNPEDLVDAA